MNEKIRLISLAVVDSFMTFCFIFSIISRKDVSSAVFCGFAAVFSTYLLLATLIPNRENEYSGYKRIYAPHLDGVFTYDKRYYMRLLRIISFINNVNPKIALIYAPKLISSARTNREKAVVNYFCGVCCENAGDMAKACDYYIDAVRLDSNYNQAYIRLACVYNMSGKHDLRDSSFDCAMNFNGKSVMDVVAILESTRLNQSGWRVFGDYIKFAGIDFEKNFVANYVFAIINTFSDMPDKASEYLERCVALGIDADYLSMKLEYYKPKIIYNSEVDKQ